MSQPAELRASHLHEPASPASCVVLLLVHELRGDGVRAGHVHTVHHAGQAAGVGARRKQRAPVLGGGRHLGGKGERGGLQGRGSDQGNEPTPLLTSRTQNTASPPPHKALNLQHSKPCWPPHKALDLQHSKPCWPPHTQSPASSGSPPLPSPQFTCPAPPPAPLVHTTTVVMLAPHKVVGHVPVQGLHKVVEVEGVRPGGLGLCDTGLTGEG